MGPAIKAAKHFRAMGNGLCGLVEMTLSRPPTRCKHCKKKFTAEERGKRLHPECIEPWTAAFQEAQKRKAMAKRRSEAKVERAADRRKREEQKRTSQWEAECRAIVQKIARIRDRNDGCISCHMGPTYGGQWHGSHFRSHGAASAVQFNLWNIHKACAQCNLFKSGNIAAYRPRLVEKIGQEKVDWLMSQNQVVRHSVAYYKRFKAVMGKRLRRMEKRA